MKKFVIKNPDLTEKAILWITKNGRNEFNKMINKLIEEHKSPTKLGWIKHKR
jgi:predicted 3-demethylubiquinone-9 3-methyltransferase (glyoxalase superfamily)